MERNIQLTLNTIVLFPVLFFSWNFFFLCQITRGVWHSVHPTIQGHHYYVVISKIVSAHRTEGKVLWHYDYKHPFLLIKKKFFKTPSKDRSRFMDPKFTSVAQSCPTLCNPMDCSMPGLPVHHQPPELTQTHVHLIGDAIQPSHPLLSLSPPAFNLSQHQGLFQ